MSTFNWENGYQDGVFRIHLFFTKQFGVIPNRFIYRGEDSFDLKTLDTEELKKAFPNAFVVTDTVIDNQSTSCIDDEDEDDDDVIYITDGWVPTTVNLYDERLIIEIESNIITIHYYEIDPKEILDKLLKIIPIKEDMPEEAEIKLVAFDQEYYTINSKIEPTTINLDENYNDDIKPVIEDLNEFLSERKSGVALLHGKMGSGKTSLIRHLITNNPQSYILVTPAIASHLASPEFISFMLGHRDSVFILEDCEQILIDRTNSMDFSGALANILNMSDGLMSDIFNIKFLCTFNADIDKIDEALLRKGRCFVNYEFTELNEEKTKALLNKQGITLDEYQPMTLAEIYNYGDTDCAETKKPKIGFNVR